MVPQGLYNKYLNLSSMQRYQRSKLISPSERSTLTDDRYCQVEAAINQVGKEIYQRFNRLQSLYGAGLLRHKVYTKELKQLEMFLLDPDLVNSKSLACTLAEMLAVVNNHLN